jgi:hypothetical protein
MKSCTIKAFYIATAFRLGLIPGIDGLTDLITGSSHQSGHLLLVSLLRLLLGF